MLGITCIMPWRSSFPCHRMCCGPATLLWFASSVFRVADKIGIDGHVSFLPQKKKEKVESSYRTSCHGEAAPLVIGCAVDPTLFCGMLICLSNC